MLIILIIFIPLLAFVTIYRMWLNGRIYRIKGYKGIVDSKAKRYSEREIDRMHEFDFFLLFCFFTFFWIRYTARYKSFQVKSNYMMLLTLVIIMLLVFLVIMATK